MLLVLDMIGIVPILVGISLRGTLLGSLSNLLGAKRRIFILLDDRILWKALPP